MLIKYKTALALYGADGGDYKEEKVTMMANGKDIATIHHHIEDIFNGEEIFEDFLSSL